MDTTSLTPPTCIGCNYVPATYFTATPVGIARGGQADHIPACDYCAELTLCEAHKLATRWGRTTDPYEKWVITVDEHSGARHMARLTPEVLQELHELRDWGRKYPT